MTFNGANMDTDWLRIVKLLVNNDHTILLLLSMLFVLMTGFLLWYSIECYRTHCRGGEAVGYQSTLLEGFALAIIMYVLVDDPRYMPVLAVTVFVMAIYMAVLRLADRLALRLARWRHRVPGEPPA